MEPFGIIWSNFEQFFFSVFEPFVAIWSDFGAIWTLLEIFGAIWCNLEKFEAILSNMGPFGATWSYLKLFGATWSHLKPYEQIGAIWSNLGLFLLLILFLCFYIKLPPFIQVPRPPTGPFLLESRGVRGGGSEYSSE